MKHQFNLTIALYLGICAGLMANNIQVSNVSTTGQNTTAGTNNSANYTLVEFDLSWDNSWRTSSGPSNWDAAWVFVKFRVGSSNPVVTGASSSGTTVTVSSTTNLRAGMPVVVSSGTGTFAANTVISSISSATQFVVSATPSTALSNATVTCQRIWEHASLDVSGGHTAPSGSVIDVANDSTGVFIYRNADGTGSVNYQNVQLRWKYGINGVADDALTQVQVYAIEMVYVPQGNFSIGSGGNESNRFYTYPSTNVPYSITGEGAITVGQTNGNLYYTPTGTAGDGAGPVPTAFPKGHNAFYCMKYEISQGQYCAFLNTLTRNQQSNRVTMDDTLGRYAGGHTWSGSYTPSEISNLTTPANRNGLRFIVDPGGIIPRTYACDLNTSATLPTGVNQSDDGEWIAMNQLNWMDGCAYMDWAGLRPMTELEYEKACRGDQAPVADEYAWGSTSITEVTGINNVGANNETFTNAGANCASNCSVIGGPLRVGVFAGGATTRAQAGATYYGIMDMSGNLLERPVTIGNADGRAFTGVHGNGRLSANGHANQTSWPGLISGEVTGASGSGVRGGHWTSSSLLARVSHRNSGANALTNRNSSFGFRGVRLFP
jgi:formylglycine-generating enzyme required for sulfatase activity